MKSKLLKSMAAVLALASAGVANAGIDSPIGGNNGELFLTVWDPTTGNEASFNLGLNLNVATFNGAGSYTFTNIFSDPVFLQYFGPTSTGGTNLSNLSAYRYNVVASRDALDAQVVLFTSAGPVATLQNSAVENASGATLSYQTALGGTCDSCGTDIKASPKNAGDFWSNNFNGAAGTINNAGAIGTSLSFYRAASTVESSGYEQGGADPSSLSAYAHTWLLSADGTLTYNAVSAVPVPAAVWLLGSGLLGLLGVGRRRAVKTA